MQEAFLMNEINFILHLLTRHFLIHIVMFKLSLSDVIILVHDLIVLVGYN